MIAFQRRALSPNLRERSASSSGLSIPFLLGVNRERILSENAFYNDQIKMADADADGIISLDEALAYNYVAEPSERDTPVGANPISRDKAPGNVSVSTPQPRGLGDPQKGNVAKGNVAIGARADFGGARKTPAVGATPALGGARKASAEEPFRQSLPAREW